MSAKRSGAKNEIYVDILERLTVLFNNTGYVTHSEIDGSIQMKSYLSGNPPLRLALNEDLVVGRENAAAYNKVVLDDCNFHECVNTDDFDTTRSLSLVPPDGEFVVMNYRMSTEFRPPYAVTASYEIVGPYKAEVTLKIRSDYPERNVGQNVQIKVPTPRAATSVAPKLVAQVGPTARAHGAAAVKAAESAALEGQTAEYIAKDRCVMWQLRKFPGGSEQTLKIRMSLPTAGCEAVHKECGPVAMSFDIPMYSVSDLNVRYLRVEGPQRYKLQRWVRYITTSTSYVARL